MNKWQYSIRNILISSESNGHYQASGPGSDASQSPLWKTESIPASGALSHYGSKRAAPGPAVRHCIPLSHPYKAGDRYASWAHVSFVFAAYCASGLKPVKHVKTDVLSFHSAKMGAHSKPVKHQESSTVTNFRQNTHWKSTSDSAFSQKSQNSLREAFSAHSKQFRPVAHPISLPKGPSAHAVQPEKSPWMFTHSFGPQIEEKRGSHRVQAPRKNKAQVENVHPVYHWNIIDDMCHQFGLYVFSGNEQTSLWELTEDPDCSHCWNEALEPVKRQSSPFSRDIWSVEWFLLSSLIFMTLTGCALPSATLDSAVTLGQHGAKNFLMRDSKGVVQCVFYENVRHKDAIRTHWV